MFCFSYKCKYILLAGISALATTSQSVAQTATELETIVIEGEKNKYKSQKTPASITQISRQDVEDAGLQNIKDIANTTPNVVLNDQGSQRFTVNTIRGIGNTIRTNYFNSSLGIYLDGVPLTTAEFSQRLGNIENIEILRGPQGTLFGHNTAAGVINLTSRKPGDKSEFDVESTVGNLGQRQGSIWFGGPITGKDLTSTLFFDYSHRNGYTDYLDSSGTIDGLETYTGSGSIHYKPDNQLTIVLSGSIERVNQGSYAYQPFDQYKKRVLDISPPNKEVRDSQNMNANVTYDFGKMQVVAITGFQHYDLSADQDLNYNHIVSTMGGGDTTSDEKGHQISQEFRLKGEIDRLSWLVGSFFLNESSDYDYLFNMRAFGSPSLNASHYKRREIAGFGEVTWNIIGGLDLTTGIRVSDEKHALLTNNSFDQSASFNMATPKYRIAYRFDDEKLVYISAVRGAKSGGYNRIAADRAFDPEYLWNYEAGLKTQWFDKKLTLNSSIYYIDWKDQQVSSLVGANIVQIVNAGRSHSKGIELEADWQPIEGLDLSGYLGIISGEYDTFIGSTGKNLAGNKLVNTPSTTAGVAGQYRWALQSLPFDAFMRAEYHFIGDQYFDVDNKLEQEGYGLVNLRVGVEKNGFSSTLFVKNLFDKDYRAFGYRDFENSPFASNVAVAGQSRMIGVTLKARF